MTAIKVTQHLYLTEDKKRVVPEGDPDARWLWATPGMAVNERDAIRYGLLPAPESAAPPAAPVPPKRKPGRPPAAKLTLPTENKKAD